jgi:hypothetical protein
MLQSLAETLRLVSFVVRDVSKYMRDRHGRVDRCSQLGSESLECNLYHTFAIQSCTSEARLFALIGLLDLGLLKTKATKLTIRYIHIIHIAGYLNAAPSESHRASS